ncbi:hypothetical protein ES703_124654 [subsurface metagenome]
MRTSKSIADDFLKRKAQTDAKALKESEAEKLEAEKLEAEKADELIKAVLSEKIKEIEAEKAEASKPDELEVQTTKPMSGLEIHTVEPVVPIEEKPVREKPVDRPAVVKKVRVQEKAIKEKPVEKSPEKPVVKKRWYDRIRPFGFEVSE